MPHLPTSAAKLSTHTLCLRDTHTHTHKHTLAIKKYRASKNRSPVPYHLLFKGDVWL